MTEKQGVKNCLYASFWSYELCLSASLQLHVEIKARKNKLAKLNQHKTLKNKILEDYETSFSLFVS